MSGIANSPVHRSGKLLCSSNLNTRAQAAKCNSLGSISDSQQLQPSSVGERTSCRDPAIKVSILAPVMDFQMSHPMQPIVAGYYAAPTPPRPPPQFACYCPAATDSSLAATLYDPFVPTPHPFGPLVDFSGIFHAPLVAPQPPMPPAAPEMVAPLNPGFQYHPCRWLGGPQCDGHAPGRNREMAEHLRVHHQFIGHERDVVACEWENCGNVMQRMNVARHIVSRHLFAVARCRFCGRRFSRPDVVARHERTCSGVPPT